MESRQKFTKERKYDIDDFFMENLKEMDFELSVLIAQFIETNSGKIDWDYFSEVFLSVTEKIEPLEVKLTEFLDRELSALDPIERALLCLGSYELADRIDIPYRVVINECVELAKIFGATESHKYINGVLDNLALNLRPLESNSRV